ncbi:MAG: adenylosuccinate synthase [Proteobacteria bacterium]|nr:MAG: adenylosuccinate synthase [Pseudomonadota bacterium]
MSGLVIVGAQWGDEGKGKLVDFFTQRSDLVVRFQGGNNAGHTLVVGGVTTKLHLIPSGILRPQARCLIGAGVVVNPQVLLSEIGDLLKAGIKVGPERLIVDREAHLIMQYHPLIDLAREENLGSNKIGTTGRGIGPAYEDRSARCGVRVADLLNLGELRPRLEELVREKNLYLRSVLRSSQQADFGKLWSELEEYAAKLGPYIGNGSLILDRAHQAGARIIFEGAQAALLDLSFGTVPFVTSASTLAGSVLTGCGVGPKHIDYVLGVAKAYCTRVGSGPFPTELTAQLGESIRQRGREFGTTTGRPRRCGWFDAFAVKRAKRLNGFDSLAITKLDVLTGIEKLKICIKYNLEGKEIEDLPALASELSRVEPVYIELEGWQESLEKVNKWHELPAAARLYLNTISEIVACPVTVASVSAEREATIFSNQAGFLRSFVS